MNNKELAKRVKDLRNRKGFSQELLAENSGLSLRTIQRIENGETEPRGDTLQRLADALNVTPDELIDWTQTEDRTFLFNLNSSALSFILFPLLGIIVPFILWVNKKDKIKNVYQAGVELLNFQITWSIVYFICIPIVLVIRMTTIFNTIDQMGDVSPSIVSSAMREYLLFTIGLWLLLTSYNLTFIIINMIRSHKGKKIRYYPKIKFIR